MLKVNETKFGGNYIEIDLSVHDYSVESIQANTENLKEVLDFIKHDESFKQLRERKRMLIENEIKAHIENMEYDANAISVLKTKGEDALIDKCKITHINLNAKITRDYQAIIRCFNIKIDVDGELMNLGFVNQY